MNSTIKRYRKALDNHNEVAHVWAQQSQPEGHASRMFFDGKSIFSYGRHFEIARFITDDIVLFTSDNYSVSTSKHKSIVIRAISHKTVFTVPSFNDHYTNVDYYLQSAKEEIEKAAKAKKHKDWHLNQAQQLFLTMKQYAETFDVSLNNEQAGMLNLAENGNLLSEDAKQQILKAEQERKAEQLAKKKEDIKEWINGERYALYGLGKIFLRRKDDVVETSHGAKVPVSEARLLYHAVKNNIDVRGKNIGHYTVISYNGKVLQIGCHKLDKNEIERFAKSQNW